MEQDVQISAVSETLFLPLYALALESRRENPILVDEGVVELTSQLNHHFAHSDKRLFRKLAQGRLPSTLLTTVTLRIRAFDRFVVQFLERHPDGIVVNMGCGLDDRRRRVDNGSVRWFDVDLPEVIELRRRYLPETDRMRFIPSSVLELTWLDELPDDPGDHFLFLAEGLFMYLPGEDVRSLVAALSARFSGSQLVCEVSGARAVRMMQGRFGRGKMRRQFGLSEDVYFQFGLSDSREMESWAPGISLLEEWTYYDEDEPKLRMMMWFARWELVRRIQWVARYRLGYA